MSVLVLPGVRGPHVLADFLFTRKCRSCAGEGREEYFPGDVFREYREDIWGPRSLNRMAREIWIPASSLSAKERGLSDFTEEEARAYLSALGLI